MRQDPPATTLPPPPTAPWWPTALALALAAAVSLGLARFAYGLLLPAMRADLGWSYLLAGAMNTANAAGYLVGALLLPRALVRHDARALLLLGGYASATLLAAHALTRSDTLLLALRLATGVASAVSFVCGGLLAARLAGQVGPAGAGPRGAGLVLGVYYGGVGLGIVAAALLVPQWVGMAGPAAATATATATAAATATPAEAGGGAVRTGIGILGGTLGGWPAAWVALGALAALFTALTGRGSRRLHAPPAASAPRGHAAWAPMRWALAGYLCFGLGYIGYMTFAITLLREQGQTAAQIMGFYSLLGLGVMASSWLWAGLLQRHRDGRPLARLNALLALATALPVLSAHPLVVLASGALFGAVFLSVVAATTAFVRHNLPPAAWAAGISAYTIVFAAGQIVGPGAVGWVADQAGGGALGLTRGLAVSAVVLALGAVLASRQRALG